MFHAHLLLTLSKKLDEELLKKQMRHCPNAAFRRPGQSLLVIYLNRRGRFFLRRDGCGCKFSRSRARQWWRTSDPMVVSASADVVSIGVVSIGVVSIGDDVLSIGDDVIHPTGNIMRKHGQA